MKKSLSYLYLSDLLLPSVVPVHLWIVRSYKDYRLYVIRQCYMHMKTTKFVIQNYYFELCVIAKFFMLFAFLHALQVFSFVCVRVLKVFKT